MLVLITAIAIALVATPIAWASARLLVAWLLRVRLRSVSLGYPASPGLTLATWTWRGVEWELSLIPFGVHLGFDPERPPWRRLLVGVAGPVGAAALAIVTLYGGFLANAPPGKLSPVVLVEGPGPAMAGGLRTGDRVLSIDGVPTPDFEELAAVVRPRPDRRVPVVVERGGHPVQLEVALGHRAVRGVDEGLLGVRADVSAPQIPLADPSGWAWDRTLDLLATVPVTATASLTGQMGVRQGLGAPRPTPWPLLPFLVANFALLFAIASLLPLPPFTLGEGVFGAVGEGFTGCVRGGVAALTASYLVLSVGYFLRLLS